MQEDPAQEHTQTQTQASEKDAGVTAACLRLRQTLAGLQNYPIIGRLVAHAPGFYWAALLDVKAGECEWEEDD